MLYYLCRECFKTVIYSVVYCNHRFIIIEEKNNLDEITSKINVIMDLREKIKFNVNSNLLMDKLIIELGRCDKK